MVYFQKQCVPDKFKVNTVPGTVFAVSESGWITKEIYYIDWFKYFLELISPARPVLLLQDGHSSHVSIELIELAQANDIH